MVTSIHDLTVALGEESESWKSLEGRAAVTAIASCGTSLTLLGAYASEFWSGERAAVTRRLADSCDAVTTAFEQGPGRAGDLARALGDLIALDGSRFTSDDAWAVASALAVPLLRFGTAVSRSGNYADTPELIGLADRAHSFLQAAARDAPAIPLVSTLHAPVPRGGLEQGLGSGQIVLESTAEIVGVLRHRGREPLTLRELQAISHAAEQVGVAMCALSGSATPGVSGWVNLRSQLDGFGDGRAVGGRDRFFTCASRVVQCTHDIVSEIDAGVLGRADAGDLRRAAALIPQLVDGCARELYVMRPSLVVAGGPRPLREARVADWLQGQPALADFDDIDVINRTLSAIRVESVRQTGIEWRDNVAMVSNDVFQHLR